MNVAGIFFGHNASAALADENGIVAIYQEERFRPVKNYTGFPTSAFHALVTDYLGGNPNLVDRIVFPTVGTQEYHYYFESGRFTDGHYFARYRDDAPASLATRYDSPESSGFVEQDLRRLSRINGDPLILERALALFESELGVSRDRFSFISHHVAHALSAGFDIPPAQPTLVFTLDGSGDNECATVSVFEMGRQTVIGRAPRYSSPARFYREVTAYLGLKPDEHEPKVMGLAAYCEPKACRILYDIFHSVLWLEDGQFASRFPMDFLPSYLLEQCQFHRFDEVAGAAQYLIESVVCDWVLAWIERTGITDIAVAGGIFHNVKLNQRLGELTQVRSLTIVPSPGDESLVIGCCYHGLSGSGTMPPHNPLRNLQLGPAYADAAVETAIATVSLSNVRVLREGSLLELAVGILSRGGSVGRFAGRAEFGARALGGRSILADPRDRAMVERINRSVKGRDFWMPFAPSILAEDWELFVKPPYKSHGLHMLQSYQATRHAGRTLPAAIHHGDYSIRPQKVLRDVQPDYYRFIERFKAATGVGAILNTSLNLHGAPLACSPADALNVFAHSQLSALLFNSVLIVRPGWLD